MFASESDNPPQLPQSAGTGAPDRIQAGQWWPASRIGAARRYRPVKGTFRDSALTGLTALQAE